MGFWNQISLNNIVGAVTGQNETVNTIVDIATTPSTNTSTSSGVKTIAGSVVAGVANALTGGQLGNGSNQNTQAFTAGQFIGNLGNGIIQQNMPSVVNTVKASIDADPALNQVIDNTVSLVANSAKKTFFNKVADWVKEHKMLVFGLSLIPIFFIVKPFLFAKKSVKRYKR